MKTLEELDAEAEQTIKTLEAYERNWHIFKILLVVISTIVLVFFIVYESNKTIDQISNVVKNNRDLICAVATSEKVNTDVIKSNCN